VRAKELRERSDEDLVRLRNETTEQLFKARLQNATHQLDNTSKIAKARREVARINTVLAERARRPAANAAGKEE
jgi:large subunit ribosomal protein L29